MVGEQALEMQQAGWLSATRFNLAMPEWLNVWFGIYPTFESVGLQVLDPLTSSYVGQRFVTLTFIDRPRRKPRGRSCHGAVG